VRTPSGGTADVLLANHALSAATEDDLHLQPAHLRSDVVLDRASTCANGCASSAVQEQRPVFGLLTDAYLEFLDLGGDLRWSICRRPAAQAGCEAACRS
jgi:hypothetical protein